MGVSRSPLGLLWARDWTSCGQPLLQAQRGSSRRLVRHLAGGLGWPAPAHERRVGEELFLVLTRQLTMARCRSTVDLGMPPRRDHQSRAASCCCHLYHTSRSAGLVRHISSRTASSGCETNIACKKERSAELVRHLSSWTASSGNVACKSEDAFFLDKVIGQSTLDADDTPVTPVLSTSTRF